MHHSQSILFPQLFQQFPSLSSTSLTSKMQFKPLSMVLLLALFPKTLLAQAPNCANDTAYPNLCPGTRTDGEACYDTLHWTHCVGGCAAPPISVAAGDWCSGDGFIRALPMSSTGICTYFHSSVSSSLLEPSLPPPTFFSYS